jgi:hypothetical protein
MKASDLSPNSAVMGPKSALERVKARPLEAAPLLRGQPAVPFASQHLVGPLPHGQPLPGREGRQLGLPFAREPRERNSAIAFLPRESASEAQAAVGSTGVARRAAPGGDPTTRLNARAKAASER